MQYTFDKRYIWIPLLWAAILLLQAWWTPIHIDEAYYWTFSRQLAWGYFDHPPMVALLIKLSAFLPGALGVRLFTILAHLLTLLLIWRMIENTDLSTERKTLTFCLATLGLPLFHIYGFITTADVPLLLFAGLFFYAYKKVCEEGKLWQFVAWGIIMGLMMLSKYHGALVIIFVLASHPKLLLNPKTYLAGAIGLAIWSPHIYWQYQHDWISFRYHLSERANNSLWYHPLEFIGNALLVFNPIFIGLFIRVLRNRWRNTFERGLYFTLFGFILFFALQTWRDHVQPQWLVVTYIPFLVLLLNRFQDKQFRYLKIAFWCSLPLLIGLHIVFSFDLLPRDLDIFRKKERTAKINELADGRPVVFANSYKEAAIYSWYHPDELIHSYNDAGHRKNQFNIWMNDSLLHNQNVYVHGAKYMKLPKEQRNSFDGIVSQYFAYDKIQIIPAETTWNADGEYKLSIENPYAYSQAFGKSELSIYLALFKEKRMVKLIRYEPDFSFSIAADGSSSLFAEFGPPADVEADAFGFAVGKLPWPAGPVYKTYDILE